MFAGIHTRRDEHALHKCLTAATFHYMIAETDSTRVTHAHLVSTQADEEGKQAKNNQKSCKSPGKVNRR